MDIEKHLEQIKSRYEELGTALSDPATYEDPKAYARLSKEHSDLSRLVEQYDRWKTIQKSIRENQEIIDQEQDRELTEMARAENEQLQEELAGLEEAIKENIVPRDPDDSRNAIVEIRAGTGGDEAALFAGDLYGMYRRYSEQQGWKMDILSLQEGDHGGYKEIVFQLGGREVFGKMKYESGVHRVQRVPKTESQGRVHTSAATVAVLPEAEEVDVRIDPSDVEFEAFRATGAGGQHINTTDSAVRLHHIPTGEVVTCQEERSQLKNREKAMQMLRSKLYEAEQEKKRAEREAERKSQVSSGDRSAKIRTYNFPQGRFTDHRINLTLYNLEEIMKGELDEVIKALRVQENLEKLGEVAQ